jgi:hypothetical protein
MRICLTLLLLGIIVLALGCSGTKDASTEEIEWLFVQNADHISLQDGVLTLDGIGPTVLFFSDRPQRIAAHGSTTDFVSFWGKGGGTDNFDVDPPNATLSIVTETADSDVVLTLSNPRLEGERLQYDVAIVDGQESLEGGPGSLFIDVVGAPATPVSVAGVDRRVTRRTVARVAY